MSTPTYANLSKVSEHLNPLLDFQIIGNNMHVAALGSYMSNKVRVLLRAELVQNMETQAADFLSPLLSPVPTAASELSATLQGKRQRMLSGDRRVSPTDR